MMKVGKYTPISETEYFLRSGEPRLEEIVLVKEPWI
jgi:hypothetical protein